MSSSLTLLPAIAHTTPSTSVLQHLRPYPQHSLRAHRHPLLSHPARAVVDAPARLPCTRGVSRGRIHNICDTRNLPYVFTRSRSHKCTDSQHIAYAFLNPDKVHGLLAVYIAGIAVAYSVLFLLVRGIVVVRSGGLRKVRWGFWRGEQHMGSLSVEDLRDWEEVQVPGRESRSVSPTKGGA